MKTRFYNVMALTMIIPSICFSYVYAAPLLRIFELGLKPGKQDEFNQAGVANLTASINSEAGTLAMYAASPQNNPDIAYLFEVYADDNAYKAHIAGIPYKTYLMKAPELLTEHRKLTETEAQFFAEKPSAIRVATYAETPVIRFSEFTVKAEYNSEFHQKFFDLMTSTIKTENGALAMYAATVKGFPEQWRVVEIYENNAAYALHRQTHHFHYYRDMTKNMVQEEKTTELKNRILVNKGGLYFNATQTTVQH